MHFLRIESHCCSCSEVILLFLFLIYLLKMARQKGLEPLAYCLEGSCSIQLSYWRICKYIH